jgi:uncharacterized surface protein with fasciclin (FAS1) repeats
MKKYSIYARTVILIAAVSLGFSSCNKDDDEPLPGAGTITSQVVAGSDFSLLESSVVKAGLTATLDGAGPFTVFAPNDAAFNASGVTNGVIGTLTADQLKAILLYHTIGSKILAADVPAGPNARVVTAGGDSVFVTRNAAGVYINGVKVTTADVDASNGVIHVIEKVLMPPAGNIVEVASADTTFSYLVAAVLRASTGTTNVAAVLSGSSILTVFAPTNNAFRKAGFATIDAINAADPNTLAAILTYHVVQGRVFSSDLVDAAQPTTVNGAKVTIGLSGGGATVKGTTNSSASNITAANIMARNGVIHVIDEVLLP